MLSRSCHQTRIIAIPTSWGCSEDYMAIKSTPSPRCSFRPGKTANIAAQSRCLRLCAEDPARMASLSLQCWDAYARWPYFSDEGAEAQRGHLSVRAVEGRARPQSQTCPQNKSRCPLALTAAEGCPGPTPPSLGRSVLVFTSSSETSPPEDQKRSGNFSSFSLEVTQEGRDSAPHCPCPVSRRREAIVPP